MLAHFALLATAAALKRAEVCRLAAGAAVCAVTPAIGPATAAETLARVETASPEWLRIGAAGGRIGRGALLQVERTFPPSFVAYLAVRPPDFRPLRRPSPRARP